MPIQIKQTFITANFLLSLLIITGCATVADTTSASTKTKATTQKVQTEQVTVDNAMSEREKLNNLLLESFDVPLFISALSLSDSKSYRNCAMSESNIQESEAEFRQSLADITKPLSNEEVSQYLTFMKKGGSDFNLKYNHFIYSLAVKEKKGIEYSLDEETDKLMKTISKKEIWAVMSLNDLPNPTIRKFIFPVGNEKISGTEDSLESYRTKSLSLLMSLTTIKNCITNPNQS